MSSSPRLMTGQGAIIAAGAIDYPAEYLGAADETRAMLGISKVMTLSLHLRSPHHTGRGIRHVPGAGAGPAGRQGRILRRGVQPPAHAAHAGALGDRPQARAARHERRAQRRNRQGSGDHADDQRLPRARAPDRGSRPAGRGTELPRRTRPGDLRSHDLGSRPRISHRQPGRSHRRGRAQGGGHAARDPGDAARRRIAARSAAST